MKKYIQKFNRWWAKRKIVNKNKKDLEYFSLIEEYLTNQIIKGEKYRNNQLIEVQSKVEEIKKLLNFLKETR